MKYLQKQLRLYAQRTENSPDKITDIISAFQNEINASEYRDTLMNGRITFGRVQKLLNLYLKYKWVFSCENRVHPPHCPIDSIILGRIKWKGPPWTSPAFEKEEYEKAIKMLGEEAENMSLAEWELRTFRSRSDFG